MYIFIIAIFVVFLSIVYFSRIQNKDIPGPIVLPVIGSAWALGRDSSHLHVVLTKLADKYGPIYKLKMGSKPFVVLSDPNLVREALSGADPPVLLRYVSKTAEISQRGKSLFNATEREFWAVMRRICTPMIRTISVPLNQIIMEERDNLFTEMDKHIDKEVHLNPLFVFFSRNVFLRILQRKGWVYGKVTTEQEKYVASLAEILKNNVTILDFIPALDFIRKFSRNDGMRHSNYIHGFVKKILDERKPDLPISIEGARDLLDVMLLEMKQHPEVTEDSIIGTIRSILVAGTYTSADTLDWMLLFLCTHPDIQEKCFKEISDTLHGRPPTMEDQAELPYLDNVIKETFRLRPPAPLALTRLAERDFEVGGYNIEKGTMIVQNIYGIGNTETFYKNHTEFDPERWARNPELSSNLIHFGVGPAICLGMPIAKQEVFLTAVSLLQKYKFQIGKSSPTPDFSGEFKIVFNPKEWHTTISRR